MGGSPSIDTYDEYGIPGATNVGRFQYTGQAWLAELGMYYYKARIYSPTLGRFLQVDPIGYKDQINLYAYVGNDPVNHADPSGLLECPPACSWADVMGAAEDVVQTGSKAGVFVEAAALTIPAIIINTIWTQPAGESPENLDKLRAENARYLEEAGKKQRGPARAPGERKQAAKPDGSGDGEKHVKRDQGIRKDNQSGRKIRPAPERPTPPPPPALVPRTKRQKRKAGQDE
jgi:RHS repeat-associated protein